jgi:hypothetical protein
MKKGKIKQRWLKKESSRIIAILDKRVATGLLTKELVCPPSVYAYKIDAGYEIIAFNIHARTEHKINTFYVVNNRIVASTNLLNKKGKVLVRKTEDIAILMRKQLGIRPIPLVYNT